MKLYVVRHDRAVEWGGGMPDALRHLTAKGRSRFRETARAARGVGMAVDAIVSSPLVRAVQTADLLAEGLHFEGEVTASPILASGLSSTDLPDFLETYADCDAMAIVGHNPHFTGLVADLLGLGGKFSMKKGSIVAIELSREKPEKGANFLWMVVDGKKSDPSP